MSQSKQTNTDPRLEPQHAQRRDMAPRGAVGTPVPSPSPIGPYYLTPAPSLTVDPYEKARAHEHERAALYDTVRDKFDGLYDGPSLAKNDFDVSR